MFSHDDAYMYIYLHRGSKDNVDYMRTSNILNNYALEL